MHRAYWVCGSIVACVLACSSDTTGLGSGGDDGTDFTYGVGLKYDFTRNLAARVEYQRYNDLGNSNTTGQSDVNMWSLGLMFKF